MLGVGLISEIETMNLPKWIKCIFNKEHKVSFAGKETIVTSRRFGKRLSCSPQEYVNRHAVVCGNCGEMMYPGEKIWLMAPKEGDAAKPGVLVVGEGKDQALVGCLAWECPPTAALMCGTLLKDRKIAYFESPLSQAARTGDVVIVPSIQAYSNTP